MVRLLGQIKAVQFYLDLVQSFSTLSSYVELGKRGVDSVYFIVLQDISRWTMTQLSFVMRKIFMLLQHPGGGWVAM